MGSGTTPIFWAILLSQCVLAAAQTKPAITALANPKICNEFTYARGNGETATCDMRNSFSFTNGLQWNYYIEDTPVGTGMAMLLTGALTGTPTVADYTASQNGASTNAFWTATVFACGTQLQNGVCPLAYRSAGLGISWEFSAIPYYTGDSENRPIPSQNLKVNEQFQVSFRDYFVDVSNPTVRQGIALFEIDGLPSGSGMALNPDTGLLSGIPEVIDLQWSPITPLVRLTNTRNDQSAVSETTSDRFELVIEAADIQRVGSVQPQTTIEGTIYQFSLSPSFQDSFPLDYTVTGFETGSGFSLGIRNGVLQGTGNAIDVAASPMSIVVTATNAYTKTATQQFQFDVTALPRYPPQCQNSLPALQKTQGDSIQIDMTPYCTNQDATITTWTITTGLVNSGLMLQQNTGVLLGTLNLADFQNTPLRLNIQAQNDLANPLTTSFIYTINVARLNTAPTLTAYAGQGFDVTEGEAFTQNIQNWFEDNENDPFTCSATTVSGGSIPTSYGIGFNSQTCVVSGTPNLMAVSQQIITWKVTAKDSLDLSSPSARAATLAITVHPRNQDPTTTQTPIPPAEATYLEYFRLNLLQYFVDPEGQPLTCTTPSIVQGSGLTLASELCVLQGTMTLQDAMYSTSNGGIQIQLTVTDNAGGSVDNSVMINVKVPPVCTNPIPNSDLPIAYVTKEFYFDASSYCTLSPGVPGTLVYTATGFPTGSELSMNSAGIITGVINEADLRSSPATLTITATNNGASDETQYVMFVQPVVKPNCDASKVPQKQCYSSQDCTIDFGQVCSDTDVLTYSMESYPCPTPPGLVINPSTGMITGNMTACDVQYSPITISIIADDSKGGVTKQDLTLQISAPQPPTFDTFPQQPNPENCGSLYSFAAATWTSGGTGVVTYALSGAPPESDVKIDNPRLGTVIGILNLADVKASPYQLSITATSEFGSSTQNLDMNVLGIDSVVVKGQIPVQTALEGQYMSVDLNPYFTHPAGSVLKFEIVSTTSQNFQVDVGGYVVGTPNQADVDNSPVLITVRTSNEVPCGGGTALQTIQIEVADSNHPPVITKIDSSVYCHGTDYTIMVEAYDAEQQPVTFTITGLPPQGGFKFEPYVDFNKAAIVGSPNLFDEEQGRYVITIYGNDGETDGPIMTFTMQFEEGKSKPIAQPPIPSPVTAIMGERFIGYFNYHFSEPLGEPLIYSAAGLPAGSGLGIGPVTGIFSGTPNEADYRASPLLISIYSSNEYNPNNPDATCAGDGGRARSDFIMVVEQKKEVAICLPIPIDNSVVEVSKYYTRDVSRYFNDPNNQGLTFALRGLPRGSGLSINPRSGIISGIVTEADQQASPLYMIVIVSNSVGDCQSNFVLTVTNTYVSPSPGNKYCFETRYISQQTVVYGENFYLDMGTFVPQNNNVRLVYQTQGLPRTTGFTTNYETGVFRGTPSPADKQSSDAQNGLSLTTLVSCGDFGTPVEMPWKLIVMPEKDTSCPNPCQNQNGGCQQTCTQGGSMCQFPQCNCRAMCSCQSPATLQSDGRSCATAPVDPCANNNGGCEHLCVNQDGRPGCKCYTGVLQADGRSCRNPCDYNNGGCEQLCVFTNGQAQCKCIQGDLAYDGKTCQVNPCSYNNGGCDDICLYNGVNVKCECRVGVLNLDQKTCTDQLIVVGTIPPGLVVGCQYFMFDFSTAFKYYGPRPDQLRFSVSGLPAGTGYSLSASGMMQGSPTKQDCGVAQPMSLTVVASDGNARGEAKMFVSSFCDTVSACDIPVTPNEIPLLWGIVCVEFTFDVVPYFKHIGVPLRYTATGLPYRGGLSITPGGMIQGSPTAEDCKMSPIQAEVTGIDNTGRQFKAMVTIKFRSCDCVGQTDPPRMVPVPIPVPVPVPVPVSIPIPVPVPVTIRVPNPVPVPIRVPIPIGIIGIMPVVIAGREELHVHTTAVYAKSFYYNVARFMKVSGLVYTMTGLPPGTGFRINQNGIISGSANTIDCRSVGPLRARVTGRDRTGASVTIIVNIEVDCPTTSGVVVVAGAVAVAPVTTVPTVTAMPMQIANYGQVYTLDMRKVTMCDNCIGGLRYSMQMPAGSGFAISPSGQINAVPTQVDCMTQQRDGKVALQVTANGYDLRTHTKMVHVTILGCPSPTPYSVTGSSVSATAWGTASAYRSGKPVVLGSLPPVAAFLEELLYYDVSHHFSSPIGEELEFIATGIPAESGLQMSREGVLSGLPNIMDAMLDEILIIAKDSDKEHATATLSIAVQSRKPEGMDPVFVPLPKNLEVLEGHYLSMDVSGRFHDQDDDLQFTATGLPDGSGLTFDSGILSGVPNQVDSQQPIVLRVTAVNGRNGNTVGIVSLVVRNLDEPRIEYKNLNVGESNVASIPIPQQVQVQGEPFVFGTKSLFHDPDGKIAHFTLTGLPTGSGLNMDRKTGIISGTPNHADTFTSQPLELVVNAIGDEGQVISEDMYITVLRGQEQTNNAPVSNAVPSVDGKVGIPFTYGVGSSFSDADKDELTFAIKGLPIFSGLELDSKTGLISGVPTDADAKMKPMRVTIVATDPLRQSTQQLLTMFIESNSDGEPSAPSSSSLPHTTVKEGENVRIELNNYFKDVSELSFTIHGLPEQTAFRIENGVFVGSPSVSDLAMAQPTLLGVVAENSQGLRAAESLVLSIDSTSAVESTLKNTLKVHFVEGDEITAIPEVDFVHGEWGAHSFAGYFPSYESVTKPSIEVEYSVQGMPEDVSLQMDSTTGVLYGLPTAADVVSIAKLSKSKLYPIRVQAEYSVGEQLFDTLEQIIFLRVLSKDGDLPNSPPMARSLPKVEVRADEMLLLDTMASFSDPEDDALTFTVLGLPVGSGFSIVPSSGVLFGTPSVSDVSAAQPLALTIIVKDADGGKAQETLFLTVQKESEAVLEEANGSENTAVVLSASSCNKLRWKISPFSKDKKKCSSARFNLNGKKGKGKGKKSTKCSKPVEYSAAEATCATFGARVCSSQELQEDVGRGVGCKSDRKRVWTSSECGSGQHISQGATSKSIKTKAPQCTDTNKKLPFLCCADFNQGQEFSNFEASVTKNSAVVEFDWPAYTSTQLSYKLPRQKKWSTPTQVLHKNGHAAVQIDNLSPGTKYVVRITPRIRKRPVQPQTHFFTIETPRF